MKYKEKIFNTRKTLFTITYLIQFGDDVSEKI